MKEKTLSIIYDKKEININLKQILYIKMDGNNASIHVFPDIIYQTRITLFDIEKQLDENFIKVKRGCIVSVVAIHSITDKINLNNGENLGFASRNKKQLVDELKKKQANIIHSFTENPTLSQQDYLDYYKIFDSIPIAFSDIEMIFDENNKAVDWVFRYANETLAKLEKTPLKQIIGNTFATIFPNMDSKWLRTYERVTLYQETIKIIDYSPEIDTYLDIICFPTFKGHCGCILFDISKMNFFRQASDNEKAFALFFEKLLKGMDYK